MNFDATNDNDVYAEFYYEPVLMGFKSHEAGREIYEDFVYVSIRVKGQPKSDVRREATDNDKKRFPVAWRAFEEGKAVPANGTPLDRLPGVTPSQVKELATVGVRTIDDIANLSDGNLQKIGIGARDLQNRAKAYLAKESKELTELRQIVESQAKTIEELKLAIAEKADKSVLHLKKKA